VCPVWPRRKGRTPAAQEDRAALTRRRLFLSAFILSPLPSGILVYCCSFFLFRMSR
jgi:hypothetical protein